MTIETYTKPMSEDEAYTVACSLYDGGWRASDREDLEACPDYTWGEGDVEKVCEILQSLEASESKSMTLMDLTGHESGIVIYQDKTVGVYNWCSYDDDQFPIISPFGTPIPWNEDSGVFDGATVECVSDVRSLLPGTVWLEDGEAKTDMGIVYDGFGDLAGLFLNSEYYTSPEDYVGEAYTLRDGRVILTVDLWS